MYSVMEVVSHGFNNNKRRFEKNVVAVAVVRYRLGGWRGKRRGGEVSLRARDDGERQMVSRRQQTPLGDGRDVEDG